MKFIKSIIATIALLMPLAPSCPRAFAESPAVKQQDERVLYTIYTGSQRGTYYQIGLDIQKACPQFDIQVESSDGSLNNLNNLIQEPIMQVGHRLAFVQGDALHFVMATEPATRKLIQPVQSMYDEDVMILVNKKADIRSLKDLKGKRVAVGVNGSGAWFTANSIRSAIDIAWIPVERSPEESILGVLTGEIDAMILVAGRPNKILTEMSASLKERVQLLDLKGLVPPPAYQKATLPADTYLWQHEAVTMLSVRSNLVASADVPKSAIGAITECIVKSQDELRTWGHPRWKYVRFSQRKQS